MDNASINKLVCKSAFNTQNNINLLHFQRAYHFRLRYKMNNNTRNKFTEKNKMNSVMGVGVTGKVYHIHIFVSNISSVQRKHFIAFME